RIRSCKRRLPKSSGPTTYSILQAALAEELRTNKLRALEANQPDVIATANIGCLLHLAAGAQRPVRHWIELLDSRLRYGG
ncbi:MAG: hypothetical protein E6H60_09485, partial [Betaproteobacteria bacterium]